jgi:hypothetical protein
MSLEARKALRSLDWTYLQVLTRLNLRGIIVKKKESA